MEKIGYAGRALLAVAEPGNWPELVSRLGESLTYALETQDDPSYDTLFDAVIVDGRPENLIAIAANHKLIGRRPELLTRIIDAGNPDALRGAYFAAHRQRAHLLTDHEKDKINIRLGRPQRRILAAAQPDLPAWTEPDGLITRLQRWYDSDLARAAVVSSFPDLICRVLNKIGRRLSRAEQLRALLSLYEHDGPAAVLSVLDSAELSTDVVRLAKQAAAASDGPTLLRAATEEAESTTTLIDELYRVDSGKRRPRGGGRQGIALSAVALVNARTELDWPALVAAYVDRPFVSQSTADALADQLDCPLAMLRAMLAAPPRDREGTTWKRPLAERALRQGMSGAELLAVGRPARSLLYAVGPGGMKELPGLEGQSEVRAGVAALVAEKMTDNVDAWRALRVLLDDFPGTVAELLDESVTVANGNQDQIQESAPWPLGGKLPNPRFSEWVGYELPAFVALLAAAPTTTQVALLPHLDDRTVHTLLVSGHWQPELAEHIVTYGSTRDRLVLARRKSLDQNVIARLLEWDEPEVATSLFFQPHATGAQKRAILAGVPFGSDRGGQLPLEPDLRAHLLRRRKHHWTTDLSLGCGDPEVLRHVLHQMGVKPGSGRLRMMAGLWRRHGPGEVQALLDEDFGAIARTKGFDKRLRTLVEKLLVMPDPDAALDQLRAHALVALLREDLVSLSTDTGGRVSDIAVAELPSWDWTIVIGEHRRRSFDARALDWLANHPGCPTDLFPTDPEQPRQKPAGLLLDHLSAGVSAAQVLGDVCLNLSDSGLNAKVEQAIAHEKLTPVDLVRYGHPVTAALISVPDELQLDHTVRAELAEKVLPIKGNLEAWVLLLRIAQEFSGTLDELVTTVAAATR